MGPLPTAHLMRSLQGQERPHSEHPELHVLTGRFLAVGPAAPDLCLCFLRLPCPLLEALAEPGAAPLPQGHPGLALGRGSPGEPPGQPLTQSKAWIRGGPRSHTQTCL